VQADDSGDGRGHRGGSFFDLSYDAAAASRLNSYPNDDNHYFGFRVVLVLLAP
jgi:formylglycine-generating enzyme required for sulfatase activity